MKKVQDLPTSSAVERELKREQYKIRYRKTMKSTVFSLITASAVAVLVATLWLPVLQIFGNSMAPTLSEGQIVVSAKVRDMKPGDIVAFYYGNKVLVKRYIAGPGSRVEIAEDGTVTVDGVALDEPYLEEKALGICDLEFPYQVPENSYFVMGDKRETSIDSRSSVIGCVGDNQIVGKIFCKFWPLSEFAFIK